MKAPFYSYKKMHPVTKADPVLEFLYKNYISIMKWPLQSLNLNLLENLWPDFKA